jgi:hypothetical protein
MAAIISLATARKPKRLSEDYIMLPASVLDALDRFDASVMGDGVMDFDAVSTILDMIRAAPRYRGNAR